MSKNPSKYISMKFTPNSNENKITSLGEDMVIETGTISGLEVFENKEIE